MNKSVIKAWKIQADHTMRLAEVAAPECGAEEVLIDIKAIGVNRADILQVKGHYPAPQGYDSSIVGLEYAGIVRQCGTRVQHRKVGDRIMGLIPSGAYCQQIAVHERETLIIPRHLSFIDAATIPEAFLTAYRALFIEGELQRGQWCFIRPASSAVGLAAVQLASTLGAKVIGSSRHLQNLQQAETMGLMHCVQEDVQLADTLLQLTHGEGVQVFMDMLASEWKSLFAALAADARIVLLGVLAGGVTHFNNTTFLMKRLQLKAMTMRSQTIEQRIHLTQVFQQQILPLFSEGKLVPLNSEVFAFEEANKAHTHMLKNAFSGKRVLILS